MRRGLLSLSSLGIRVDDQCGERFLLHSPVSCRSHGSSVCLLSHRKSASWSAFSAVVSLPLLRGRFHGYSGCHVLVAHYQRIRCPRRALSRCHSTPLYLSRPYCFHEVAQLVVFSVARCLFDTIRRDFFPFQRESRTQRVPWKSIYGLAIRRERSWRDI